MPADTLVSFGVIAGLEVEILPAVSSWEPVVEILLRGGPVLAHLLWRVKARAGDWGLSKAWF